MENTTMDRFMAEWKDKIPPREHKSQAELLQETVAMAAKRYVVAFGAGYSSYFCKADNYKRLELQAFQELNRC
jgi:hypothetical protein